MIQVKKYALFVAVVLPMFYFAGCRQITFPVRLDLDESLGEFDVTAGEPSQKSGTLNPADSSITVGSGTLRLDPDDISFAPANDEGSKGLTTFQGGGTFTVTVGIAAADDIATVCTTPVDEYGPFTVTVDEDGVVSSIEPSSVPIEQTTIDLINAGEISLCITVDSTVTGTITIDALSLNVGL